MSVSKNLAVPDAADFGTDSEAATTTSTVKSLIGTILSLNFGVKLRGPSQVTVRLVNCNVSTRTFFLAIAQHDIDRNLNL